MSYYGMVTEDPMYDDDGVLVDEDGCGPDMLDLGELIDEVGFDPFDTINS